MKRRCNGGNVPPYPMCGARATVVVSAYVYGRESRPLQWFACDDKDHHRHEDTTDVEIEPIETWFERCGLPASKTPPNGGH